MQGGQQHIQQATRPGPVGGRPHEIARLGEELMRQLHARQMAEQNAVPMQGSLRIACGA